LNTLEFLKQQYDQVLKESKNYALKDRETKKQFVSRLKEKAVELFKEQDWNLHGLASYIWNDLEKIDFYYAKSHFYDLFNEDEKLVRTNSEVTYETHIHNFINSECLCGAVQFKGRIFTEEIPKEESIIESSKSETEKEEPYSNPITEFLQRSAQNLKELASLADDLVKKYYENKEFAEEIEQALKNPEQLNKQSKEDEARIMALEKKLDLRQRVGEWEKLKALLLEKTQFNIAKVAKILTPPCVKCGHSGITPKHMSFNIMKREQPEIMRHLEWFKSITIKIGEKTFIFNIADWYNRQIQRGELEPPFEEIVLETAKLK